MHKHKRLAVIYLEKRKTKFPVSFDSINRDATIIMATTFISDLLGAILVGWLMRGLFALFGIKNFMPLDRTNLIYSAAAWIFVSLIFGGLYLFGKPYPNLMDENDCIHFLTKVFAFTSCFTVMIMAWTVTYILFGV